MGVFEHYAMPSLPNCLSQQFKGNEEADQCLNMEQREIRSGKISRLELNDFP